MEPGSHNTNAAMSDLKGSVLLADDSEMNQQLLSAYLKKMGVNVFLAENGEIAVTVAQRENIDLIYMDMQMPVMSGQEAVKKLRELNFEAPIIMLTANASDEDEKLCKQAGCNAFLIKPIQRKTLYEMTARYLPGAE